MSEVFDLNQYIKNNHVLIMECKEKGIPFDYDEDAVIAVYKLAKDCAKKLNVPKAKVDDFIQDCATHFFTYVVYKYNPDKNISIITYAFTAFSNIYGVQERKKIAKYYVETVSLDKLISVKKDEDPISLMDVVEDSGPTQLEKMVQEEYYSFLKEKLNEDELLYDIFVNKKSQRKISNELGISQAQVSRNIKKRLKEIRDEWEGKNSVNSRGRK